MLNRPFRPPLLHRTTNASVPRTSPQQAVEGPPSKKRRIGVEDNDATSTQESEITGSSSSSTNDSKIYYAVLWRKVSNKKHKTWDGDGVLKIRDGYTFLQNESHREIGRIAYDGPLLPGSQLRIGVYEVEIDTILSNADAVAQASRREASIEKATLRQLDEALRTNIRFNVKPVVKQHMIEPYRPQNAKRVKQEVESPKKTARVATTVPKASVASNAPFKAPLRDQAGAPRPNSERPVPRHDPTLPGALVMRRPLVAPKDSSIVDVVVDPLLCKHLREHQREGVKFMYECVMGMRPHGGEGVILADDMGLGKTLQVIALLWTLLKQNPIFGQGPAIKKALIVCPVTLIKNWRREFRKWLGIDKIGVFVVDSDSKLRITDFTRGNSYQVMVVGYEKLRAVQIDLQETDCVDIVIADEGHRLKTAQNKSAQAIKSLNTERRIILSGTPLQNDLSEFYFMADLVNPGVLGKMSAFKRDFETPIIKSRQPGATVQDVQRGEERSEELASLTGNFIIRRTADILSKYLPAKTEYVLFCQPTATQAKVYRSVLSSPTYNAVIGSAEASLQLIGILKKLCNSPSLLFKKDASLGMEDSVQEGAPGSTLINSILKDIPPQLLKYPGASGKLQVLDTLIHHLKTATEEKVVLVSHYTASLDVLEQLLSSLSYSFLRLDGNTPTGKRQGLVDKFNKASAETCFAFLLSAKAGGMGLNLVGASRLVLFDCDWNPAADLQAMARIHRDGQKRDCRIYRLLTKGALDEKIWQRQLTKLALAGSIMNTNGETAATDTTGKGYRGGTNMFSQAELRDLFSLDESKHCQTHELLGCTCEGRGTLDTARLDGCEQADEVSTSGDESDEENHLPSLSSLIRKKEAKAAMDVKKTSEITLDDIEPRTKEAFKLEQRRKKAAMAALQEYKHFDVSCIRQQHCTDGETEERGRMARGDMEAMIDDDVLFRGVLVGDEETSRVSHVFVKRFAAQ